MTFAKNHAIMITETGTENPYKTRKGNTMTINNNYSAAQKIFNMISDAECEAFCFASDHPKDKKLQECAEHMRKALKAFHEATGAKNEE